MSVVEIKKIYSTAVNLAQECKKCIDCESCDKVEELLENLTNLISKITISNEREREEIKSILDGILLLRKQLPK